MERLIFINRFFHPDDSPTSVLLTDLARHLASSGFDVTVITSRLGYGRLRKRPEPREKYHGVNVIRIWTTSFGRATFAGRLIDYLTFYVSCTLRLMREARRDDRIICQTDPPLIGILAWPAARLRGAALIHWIHDLFPEIAAASGVALAQGALGCCLTGLRNAALRQSECLVVLDDRMATRVRGLGMCRERVHVIPNWADVRPASPEDIKREWGLGEKYVIGYSGNMGRVYSFQSLMEAAEKLQDNERIAFVLIGDGFQLPALRSEVEKKRLRNVTFKPYQPAELLPQSLSAIDLHYIAVPEKMDGLFVPSKIAAILAVGRPIAFEGHPESFSAKLIAERDIGLNLTNRSPEQRAELLAAAAADSRQNETWRSNARRAFEQKFDRLIALKKWEKTLREVPTHGPAKKGTCIP